MTTSPEVYYSTLLQRQGESVLTVYTQINSNKWVSLMQKLHLALTKLWAMHAHSSPYSCQVRGDLQTVHHLQFHPCIQNRQHPEVAYRGSVIFSFVFHPYAYVQ